MTQGIKTDIKSSPLTGEDKGGGVRNRINSMAKCLRKRPTDTEKKMWKYIRANQIEDLKFRRQQPIGNYIVDFVCFEKRVVIEADGGQHAIYREKDKIRNEWLKKQGFKVLRFWDNEILTNIEGVLEKIREICIEAPSPPPAPRLWRAGNPSRRGRGKSKNIATEKPE